MSNWIKKHLHRTQDAAAIILALIGIVILIYGYGQVHGPFRWTTILEDLYANGGAELLSISLTVLVIERLNEKRSRREADERDEAIRQEAENQEKADLILQMGSPDNTFAREAVRKLYARGWMADGSAENAYLYGANLLHAQLQDARLKGANLQAAHLEQADLTGASLQDANLRGAHLQGADMHNINFDRATLVAANLQDVYLQDATLKGADLTSASLKGAMLRDNQCDQQTILPDGTYWQASSDIERFTNPDHPEFWAPIWA